MAMSAGVITIKTDTNGSPIFSGSGMALAIGTAHALAIYEPLKPLPPTDSSSYKMTYDARQSMYDFVSQLANAYAAGIVAHITTYAVAHVTTQQLGKTPNPNNPDTAINAPASPVDIPIT